jgi:Tfp pilus assembly PilM family ATPase
LALSIKKRSSSGSVGLDIDGRFLAAAEVVNGRLVRVASAELPAGVLVDGEVADRAALGAAIKDFAGTAGLPRDVQLGISNQQIVVRMLDLPKIEDASERDQAIRFQAAEAIAMPLDEAVLDHQLAGYSSGPDGTERMQVVVVAARRAMIEDYLGAATDAGLKPSGIDLDAFALVRMLAGQAGSPVHTPSPAYEEPSPTYDEPLPSEDAVTEPLPAVYGPQLEGASAPGSEELPDTEPLSFPKPYAQTPDPPAAAIAEPAPIEAPTDAPPSARVYCHLGGVSNLAIAVDDACFFTRALAARFDAPGAAMALADEIRLSIDYYMAQANALPVGDAVLSGVGSRDELLVSEIGSLLTIPVLVAAPLGALDAGAVPHDHDPRRYTVAAGLAMAAAA